MTSRRTFRFEASRARAGRAVLLALALAGIGCGILIEMGFLPKWTFYAHFAAMASWLLASGTLTLMRSCEISGILNSDIEARTSVSEDTGVTLAMSTHGLYARPDIAMSAESRESIAALISSPYPWGIPTIDLFHRVRLKPLPKSASLRAAEAALDAKRRNMA